MREPKFSQFFFLLLWVAALVGAMMVMPKIGQAALGVDEHVKQARSPESSTVYYLDHQQGKKKAYNNEQAFYSYGNTWGEVTVVEQDKLSSWPNIHLVKVSESPGVYYINKEKKARIPSEEIFQQQGFSWEEVVTITPVDLTTYQTVEWEEMDIAENEGGGSSQRKEVLVDLADSTPSGKDLPLGTEKNLVATYVLEAENGITTMENIKVNKKGYQHIKSPYNNFTAKILRWPLTYFWTLGRMSWEMMFGDKPDVLFVPAHGLPYFHPKKTVATIHDIAFKRAGTLYRVNELGAENKRLRRMINFFVTLFTLGKYNATSLDYLNWSTKYSLRRAKKIITVSHFTKQEILENYDCDPEKIKVIHNGYNEKSYKPISNKEKIDQKLNKYGLESPYILYVGRLERKKNIPALVEAFGRIKMENKDFHYKLVLVGDADYGYDEIKCLIEEYNLDSEVFLPGWVKESDLPYIYNGATSFIFPSRHEGFGIPVLQALACGVPVAASYITPLREVAGRAALYFDPYDVDSISKTIQRVTMDKKIREEMTSKGKERVQEFNWRKTAEKTLEELNSL